MLNNREWAGVIWLCVVTPWSLSKPEIRSSLSAVVRGFANRMIVLTILAMFVYVCVLVTAGRRFQLWTGLSTKDTIVWFLIVAGPLWLRISQSSRRGYFRRAALDAIGLSALLGFFLNLFVFNLWIELLLVPIIFFAIGIRIVARGDGAADAVRVASAVLTLIGWAIVIYCAWRTLTDWQEVANKETLRSLALPIWLTLGLLPFLYVMSVFVNYATTFRMMKLAGDEERALRRAKLALVLTLGPRTSAAGSFRWPWIPRLVDSTSWHAARQVVKEYRAQWSSRPSLA